MSGGPTPSELSSIIITVKYGKAKIIDVLWVLSFLPALHIYHSPMNASSIQCFLAEISSQMTQNMVSDTRHCFLQTLNAITFCERAFRAIKCFKRLIPITATVNNCVSLSFSRMEQTTLNDFVCILTLESCRHFTQLVEFSSKASAQYQDKRRQL